jgi:hypothetical protein
MQTDAPPRSILRLTGDAQGFLDSLLSNRVAPAADGAPAIYAGFLTPQGKVITDLFVVPFADGYWLDVPADRAIALEQKLKFFRLRRAVVIDRLEETPEITYTDPRLPGLPLRTLGYESLPDEARIALGIPCLTADCGPEEVFALEAHFEELHGVDFHKGCFPGQENVSRMKRRATTRKKFCRIRMSGDAPVYDTPVRAGGAEIGHVRSCAPPYAIALLRLDRAREALDKGERLMAGDSTITLDPPEWLIMPTKGED